MPFFFSFKDVATLLLLDRGLHVNATVEQDIPDRVMIVLRRSFIVRVVCRYDRYQDGRSMKHVICMNDDEKVIYESHPSVGI